MKACRTCKEPTADEDLEPLYKGYGRQRCKYCAQKASKKRKPPDKKYHRNYFLKVTYGITLKQYHEIFDLQKGVCAICKCSAEYSNHGVLAVDHCHQTRKVRGLLCTLCNTGLGKFRDNPELLHEAAKYLTVGF